MCALKKIIKILFFGIFDISDLNIYNLFKIVRIIRFKNHCKRKLINSMIFFLGGCTGFWPVTVVTYTFTRTYIYMQGYVDNIGGPRGLFIVFAAVFHVSGLL